METCFAYIRVSTTKQGSLGVSLQEQRSAIDAYAAHNAIAISEWFEEQETAAKRGRPVFSKMMHRLQSHEVSGVIIHKIDRSARNLRDWADLGELIDKGLKVHFATESLDLASRGGRLSADIQAVVAADFIRNLREETRKGFYGRLKQGLYPLMAPLGYLDTGKGRPKACDPQKAPLVRSLFEAYATGKFTLITLRQQTNVIGLTNRGGKTISINGLSRLLNNPFYAGLIRLRHNGEMFQGVHEPLVSMALFRDVQEILAGRMPKRKFKHDFLFRQMVRCASCGCHLVGERQKGRVYYRCHTLGCRGTTTSEVNLDEHLRSALSAISLSSAEVDALLAHAASFKAVIKDNREESLRTLAARIEKVKIRIDRLTDALVDGLIERDVYQERRGSLLEELTLAEQEKRKSETENGDGIDDLANYLERAKTASFQYEMGTVDEKRQVVRNATSNLKLDRKTVVVELKNSYGAIAEHRNLDQCDPCSGTARTALVHKLFDFIDEDRRLIAANDNVQRNAGSTMGEGGKLCA